jgi:hypothetical protein
LSHAGVGRGSGGLFGGSGSQGPFGITILAFLVAFDFLGIVHLLARDYARALQDGFKTA